MVRLFSRARGCRRWAFGGVRGRNVKLPVAYQKDGQCVKMFKQTDFVLDSYKTEQSQPSTTLLLRLSLLGSVDVRLFIYCEMIEVTSQLSC